MRRPDERLRAGGRQTCGGCRPPRPRAVTCTRTAEAREPDAPQPRLIVLEPLLEQDSDAAHSLFQMLICGKETRGFEKQDDMRRLLTVAELNLLSVDRLSSGHHTFECAP